ncbi:MAG: hypothetical protein ACJAQT_002199 [Akkermansiaceae bacterium]|jgi:hypothetical protein
MTLGFLVESGMLIFFGVGITLVVLKGILVAQSALQDGESGRLRVNWRKGW